jgi:hypothetical protein
VSGDTGQTDRLLTQSAPYPHLLEQLVRDADYMPGWRFRLAEADRGQGSSGLTLFITVTVPHSYLHSSQITVAHLFPVPPAAYDARSWQHWLLEQILLVHRHEACEFLTVAGAKPYAPSHGPGNDPYLVREIGTDTDVKTSFRGEANP